MFPAPKAFNKSASPPRPLSVLTKDVLFIMFPPPFACPVDNTIPASKGKVLPVGLVK